MTQTGMWDSPQSEKNAETHEPPLYRPRLFVSTCLCLRVPATMRSITKGFILIMLCLVGKRTVDGFVIGLPPSALLASSSSTTTTLAMTVLSYNGKKMDFKPGTPLSRAVQQLGVKVKYSCKKYVTRIVAVLSHTTRRSDEDAMHSSRCCFTRSSISHRTTIFLFLPQQTIIITTTRGDCATCQVSLAGRMTRCCIGKVPEPPRLKSLQEKGLEIRG
jgi:hypothetical protein